MLPENTYYTKEGALINANRSKQSLANRVKTLEEKVEILVKELAKCQAQLQSIQQ